MTAVRRERLGHPYPDPFTLLVCGDRHWTDQLMVATALTGLVAIHGHRGMVVIEGGAPGADRVAGDWARHHEHEGVQLRVFPANWAGLGKAAGPSRNAAMLAEGPELVLAFHDNLARSTGTRGMVALAVAKGVPVWVACHA